MQLRTLRCYKSTLSFRSTVFLKKLLKKITHALFFHIHVHGNPNTYNCCYLTTKIANIVP